MNIYSMKHTANCAKEVSISKAILAWLLSAEGNVTLNKIKGTAQLCADPAYVDKFKASFRGWFLANISEEDLLKDVSNLLAGAYPVDPTQMTIAPVAGSKVSRYFTKEEVTNLSNSMYKNKNKTFYPSTVRNEWESFLIEICITVGLLQTALIREQRYFTTTLPMEGVELVSRTKQLRELHSNPVKAKRELLGSYWTKGTLQDEPLINLCEDLTQAWNNIPKKFNIELLDGIDNIPFDQNDFKEEEYIEYMSTSGRSNLTKEEFAQLRLDCFNQYLGKIIPAIKQAVNEGVNTFYSKHVNDARGRVYVVGDMDNLTSIKALRFLIELGDPSACKVIDIPDNIKKELESI